MWGSEKSDEEKFQNFEILKKKSVTWNFFFVAEMRWPCGKVLWFCLLFDVPVLATNKRVAYGPVKWKCKSCSACGIVIRAWIVTVSDFFTWSYFEFWL